MLKHFLFLSWPDYGVPPDASGLLRFLFHVRKSQAQFTKESGWKVCYYIYLDITHFRLNLQTIRMSCP